MIWLRRGLAIPLIILFFILFLVSLIVAQVYATVGSPGFYNKQMHKADMYNFIYDEALPAALDEIETHNSDEDIPVHLSKVKSEVISDARLALPPEWIEAKFESASKTFIPYFTGSSDRFTYALEGKDRAEAIAQVIKEQFLKGETFRSVYDDIVYYVAGKLLENIDQLPYNPHFTREEIETAIKKAAPPEWIITQTGPVVDSITPYLTGDASSFTIDIAIKDRVDIIAAVVADLLSRNETYQYLIDEMIFPTVQENLGQIVNLPFKVSLTDNEIKSAIARALPDSWLEGQVKLVIDNAASYAKGDSHTIAVKVDLTDRKTAVNNVLTEQTDKKLRDLFNSMPVCSPQQFATYIQHISAGSIPAYRPADVAYEQFKTALDINIPDVVKEMVVDKIPDSWTYTEADLRSSLGVKNQGILDDARKWVSGGYIYTEADLRDDLSIDQNNDLEDIRGWVADGYTVTEQKMRNEIAEDDPDNLNELDDARHVIHTVKKWQWPIALVPFLLLVGIAFLAGRGWKGRLLWGVITLFVASLIIFIGISVVQSQVVTPEVKDAFDMSDKSGFELVMLQKGQEVAVNASNSFMGGIKTEALVSTIISGLVIVGTITWSIRQSRKNEKVESNHLAPASADSPGATSG